VRPTWAALGVAELLYKVRMKPGMPVLAGTATRGDRRVLLVGLPGNPVSTVVTFQQLVRPALRARMGDRAPFLGLLQAVAAEDLPSAAGRARFERVELSLVGGRLELRRPREQSSHVLSGLATAGGVRAARARQPRPRGGRAGVGSSRSAAPCRRGLIRASTGEPAPRRLCPGGRARRRGWGADKATRSWRGAPLGLTLAELLGSACGSVSIVRRELADPGWTLADGRAVRVVRAEGGHDRHPLWGVAAGLRAATTPWAVLCATDLVGLCADDVAAVASAPGQVGDARRGGGRCCSAWPSIARVRWRRSRPPARPVAALVAGLRGVPLRGHVVDANTPLDLSDA
jgi:hypothetical protein